MSQRTEPEEARYCDQDIPDEFTAVGIRDVSRRDGWDKVSGKAIFTSDVQLPGMLHAKILRCPHAHAKIKSMNTSKAEALPGVKSVLRYDDPEIKGVDLSPSFMYTGFPRSWFIPVMPLSDIGYYHGHPCGAAVAAETVDIAEEALELIDVEWEELPFVIDQVEAAEPGAPISYPEAAIYEDVEQEPVSDHPFHEPTLQGNYRRDSGGTFGDVEAGFQEADKIIEFDVRRREHAGVCAEPLCCVTRWTGDFLELWTHWQQPYQERHRLSVYFNLPFYKFRVYSPYCGYMGGAWQWSLNEGYALPIIAAILAKRTNLPVKARHDRADDFNYGSMDVQVNHHKVGFKNDGTITAIDTKTIAAQNAMFSLTHFLENTRVPNLHSEDLQYMCNIGMTSAIRCEQIMPLLSTNMILDRVATELEMDPCEVALKNDGYEGHDMEWYSEFKLERKFQDNDSLKMCLDKGKAEMDWDNKWHTPGSKKLPNGKMHGIAMTWTQSWGSTGSSGACGLMLQPDGKLEILAQQADVGLNARTAYVQVVAETTGMHIEDIGFPNRAQEDVGWQFACPGGSVAMASSGWALKKAGKDLKRQILEFVTEPYTVTRWYAPYPEAAALFPDNAPEELDIKNSIIFEKANPDNAIPVTDIAMHVAPGGDSSHTLPLFAWAWHHSALCSVERPRMCRQVYFMEVGVDTDTGEVDIMNTLTVNDVGKAISPEACEGQAYGGAVMGISRGRSEEKIYDPLTGVKLNANLIDYKCSTILESGPINSFLIESNLGWGAYGQTGIGESLPSLMPGMLSPAIYNATGVWVEDFPVTPNSVLKALGKA